MKTKNRKLTRQKNRALKKASTAENIPTIRSWTLLVREVVGRPTITMCMDLKCSGATLKRKTWVLGNISTSQCWWHYSQWGWCQGQYPQQAVRLSVLLRRTFTFVWIKAQALIPPWITLPSEPRVSINCRETINLQCHWTRYDPGPAFEAVSRNCSIPGTYVPIKSWLRTEFNSVWQHSLLSTKSLLKHQNDAS